MRTGFSACLAILLAASSADAGKKIDSTDPTIDVQLFYPSPGGLGFFSVESGQVNPHLSLSSGLFVNYARNPLGVRIIAEDESQRDVGLVVGTRVDMDLFAAVGLFDIVDLGFVFPLVYMGGLDDAALGDANVDLGVQKLTGFTQGDLRIMPKIGLLDVGRGMFAVAFVPGVVVPTAKKTAFASENDVVFAPELAISGSAGHVLRAGLNVGYSYRDRTKVQTLIVDDEVFAKLGLGFDLSFGQGSPIEIIAEAYGHTPAENGFGKGTSDAIKKEFQKSRTALELDVGIRTLLLGSAMVSIGGGGGLMPGYGAPAPRVFVGLAYLSGEVAPADEDGDTVVDERDKCPKKKEDLDGFEDDDGCPDLDNDNDNIVDEDDQCKMEAEDRDAFEDDDGCPELDNDKDGFEDPKDGCPVEAEDKDGFKDDDGCPDLDNDEDGVADTMDKCPTEAEDKDGFQDHDGCPDTDNDGDGLPDLNDLCPNHAEDKDGVADDDGCPEDNDMDGILDADDKCPNQAEVYNGIEDTDGCPEKLKVQSLVKVTEEKIEIKEKVFFQTNSAKILPKSFNLLNQVVSVMKNYRHLTKIRIEGHTDAQGPRKRNVKLSQERAESVRQYLIDHGVEPARLEAAGYGPDKPIASNANDKGREMNRRVEFVIAEQKPIGLDVSEGQKEEPAVEMNLEVPAPESAAPAPQPSGDAPMLEVGPTEATPPAAEPAGDAGEKKGKGKGKGKGKKKKKADDVEFNF